MKTHAFVPVTTSCAWLCPCHRLPCTAVAFANTRLVRSGRCHESEVAAAFRQAYGKYRSREALPDTVLRDLVRNWHPDADRTPNGYYRNLSLTARVNAFTGQVEGGSEASKAVGQAQGQGQEQVGEGEAGAKTAEVAEARV